ncbi:MAG: acyl-CoA dehydrogenase [Gammaproteobacteria bacterium]
MNHWVIAIAAIVGLLVVARKEAGASAAIRVCVVVGLAGLLFHSKFLGVLLLLAAAVLAVTGLPSLRIRWLTPLIFSMFKTMAPKVSKTEQVALDAGTVGWDGELFSGRPQWSTLLSKPAPNLSEEEQRFIDHQCAVAASMCNAYEIGVERADLPEALWEYIKKEGFLGMIIPKSYGGLGFSAKAQSAVLQKLTYNDALMVSVCVPNSLGPGELLLKYGTDEQKNYYLPRLADGREIPCFGLTGPRAGSDATSIPDVGVVCRGVHEGKDVLGIRLNFDKRWITLAPIATVVGLAFRLFDPEGLLGGDDDIGITCALIPHDTSGMEIGRRHHPMGSPFMNGPIKGKDVFIPMSYIIGGEKMVGQGWRMLVECLSVGRCISLPSGAIGAGRYGVGYAGGFTRIRRQFNVPVAEMEGVQEALARLAGLTYIAQASVRQTANMIDHGEKPAVPSAILKSQLTEMQRQILMDAMDVHGGKGLTLGPKNYLGLSFASTAVSITVEGANIMTRSLMIFGQGAVRCHPFVLEELAAKADNDLNRFDRAIFSHIGLTIGNGVRAFTQGLGLMQGDEPFDDTVLKYVYGVNRFSAALGLCADAAMMSLGSSLKFRELISARLGDILSNIYLCSMVLKSWRETHPVAGEIAIMQYACQLLLHRAENALNDVLDNFPNRWLGRALKFITMPLGRRWAPPGDDLVRSIAKNVSTASPLRDKLLENTYDRVVEGGKDNALARYNKLLAEYDKAEALYRRINKAYAQNELPAQALHPEEKLEAALVAKIVTEEEATFMRAFEAEVLELLSVDDFDFDALAVKKDQVVAHHHRRDAA